MGSPESLISFRFPYILHDVFSGMGSVGDPNHSENALISINFHDFSIGVGSPIIENVLISRYFVLFLLWRGKLGKSQIIEHAKISEHCS